MMIHVAHPGVDQAEVDRLVANGVAFAERAERDPWVRALRRAKVEAARVGNNEPIERFVRRFKAHQAAITPPSK
jgi:hypothetical protein